MKVSVFSVIRTERNLFPIILQPLYLIEFWEKIFFYQSVSKLFWWSLLLRTSLLVSNCPLTISSCYATSPLSNLTQNAEPCQGCYVEVRCLLFVFFRGICLRHSSFWKLSEVFERLCGLVAVTVGLTRFTSALLEVSAFKCSYTSLEGFWNGAINLLFCI